MIFQRFFVILLKFDLEVKGRMGQGQRSKVKLNFDGAMGFILERRSQPFNLLFPKVVQLFKKKKNMSTWSMTLGHVQYYNVLENDLESLIQCWGSGTEYFIIGVCI